jgi:DNA-binding IclR family transcriptional regulator
MIRKSSDRRYLIGPTLHFLASSVQWDVLALPEVLREFDELHRRTRETTYVGLWQEDEIVVGAVRPGVVPVVVGGLGVGQRQDAYGATAKALLAFAHPQRVERYLERLGAKGRPPAFDSELAGVRANRYAIDIDRFAEGVACLAAPVTGPDGFAIGTLSVAVPSHRFEATRESLVGAVVAAGRNASSRGPEDGSERSA